VSAPFLHWQDVALGPMVAERTGLPTVIENDMVTITEAEHWFGSGRDLVRFAVITVGAGVGYGAVVNGGIVLSDDSGLGLVGHWPLKPDGPQCPDGHRGCAQVMLASPSIVERVSSGLGRELSYEKCLNLAEGEDPVAREVVDEAGFALGRLLAAVGNLVVPQRIIVAGEGVRLAHVASGALAAGIAQDRNPKASPLEYVVNEPDATQWCRGAAVIAIQTYVLGAHPRPSS
jgi:predicted NBD/HSP70 family sugar kinase